MKCVLPTTNLLEAHHGYEEDARFRPRSTPHGHMGRHKTWRVSVGITDDVAINYQGWRRTSHYETSDAWFLWLCDGKTKARMMRIECVFAALREASGNFAAVRRGYPHDEKRRVREPSVCTSTSHSFCASRSVAMGWCYGTKVSFTSLRSYRLHSQSPSRLHTYHESHSPSPHHPVLHLNNDKLTHRCTTAIPPRILIPTHAQQHKTPTPHASNSDIRRITAVRDEAIHVRPHPRITNHDILVPRHLHHARIPRHRAIVRDVNAIRVWRVLAPVKPERADRLEGTGGGEVDDEHGGYVWIRGTPCGRAGAVDGGDRELPGEVRRVAAGGRALQDVAGDGEASRGVATRQYKRRARRQIQHAPRLKADRDWDPGLIPPLLCRQVPLRRALKHRMRRIGRRLDRIALPEYRAVPQVLNLRRERGIDVKRVNAQT